MSLMKIYICRKYIVHILKDGRVGRPHLDCDHAKRSKNFRNIYQISSYVQFPCAAATITGAHLALLAKCRRS